MNVTAREDNSTLKSEPGVFNVELSYRLGFSAIIFTKLAAFFMTRCSVVPSFAPSSRRWTDSVILT